MTNIYVRKGNCALNLVVSVIAFAATIALVLDPDAHSYPHSIAISIVFAVNCLMFFTIFTYRVVYPCYTLSETALVSRARMVRKTVIPFDSILSIDPLRLGGVVIRSAHAAVKLQTVEITAEDIRRIIEIIRSKNTNLSRD